MKQVKKLQIGKNGLTESVINQIKKIFEDSERLRISLLKSSTRDKEEAKAIADNLMTLLGDKYTYKIIGYTLIIQKWRKPKKK